MLSADEAIESVLLMLTEVLVIAMIAVAYHQRLNCALEPRTGPDAAAAKVLS